MPTTIPNCTWCSLPAGPYPYGPVEVETDNRQLLPPDAPPGKQKVTLCTHCHELWERSGDL